MGEGVPVALEVNVSYVFNMVSGREVEVLKFLGAFFFVLFTNLKIIVS